MLVSLIANCKKIGTNKKFSQQQTEIRNLPDHLVV